MAAGSPKSCGIAGTGGVLPNAIFKASGVSDSMASDRIIIPVSDIHAWETDEASGFSVSWYGATGGAYTDGAGNAYTGGGSAQSLTGNFEKFLWGLLKTYDAYINTATTGKKALYDADQAKTTILGTTRPPADTTFSFGNVGVVNSTTLKQTATCAFRYLNPTSNQELTDETGTGADS